MTALHCRILEETDPLLQDKYCTEIRFAVYSEYLVFDSYVSQMVEKKHAPVVELVNVLDVSEHDVVLVGETRRDVLRAARHLP